MIYKINNKDNRFYSILGPVFGSRKIQRVTKDRFYDDDEKEWIIETDESGNAVTVISILGGIIKNIYSEDHVKTSRILKSIYNITVSGIVPSVYQGIYLESGYKVSECELKNFLKITGGRHE